MILCCSVIKPVLLSNLLYYNRVQYDMIYPYIKEVREQNTPLGGPLIPRSLISGIIPRKKVSQMAD